MVSVLDVRSEVMSRLGLVVAGKELIGDLELDVFDLEVRPWLGKRFDSNGDDCNKKSALLEGALVLRCRVFRNRQALGSHLSVGSTSQAVLPQR